MRISRRTSDTSATTAGGPTRAAAVVAALAAAGLLAGCSSSASSPTQPTGTGAKVKPADDIQILGALELGVNQLNSAYGVDAAHTWSVWTPSDKQRTKIGLTGFLSCKGDIPQDGLTEKPVESFFRNGDDTAPTTAATTSPSGKKTTAPPATAADPGSVIPDEWVGSVALIYKDAASAASAAKKMGKFDKTNATCGPPTSIGKPGVVYFGGSVESNPSWYGGNSVFVFVDTKETATMTALAQQRGRFVVVTYTKGSSKPETGYYTLNSTKDAVNAASAATSLLSQLTDAVVNGS